MAQPNIAEHIDDFLQGIAANWRPPSQEATPSCQQALNPEEPNVSPERAQTQGTEEEAFPIPPPNRPSDQANNDKADMESSHRADQLNRVTSRKKRKCYRQKAKTDPTSALTPRADSWGVSTDRPRPRSRPKRRCNFGPRTGRGGLGIREETQQLSPTRLPEESALAPAEALSSLNWFDTPASASTYKPPTTGPTMTSVEDPSRYTHGNVGKIALNCNERGAQGVEEPHHESAEERCAPDPPTDQGRSCSKDTGSEKEKRKGKIQPTSNHTQRVRAEASIPVRPHLSSRPKRRSNFGPKARRGRSKTRSETPHIRTRSTCRGRVAFPDDLDSDLPQAP